LDEVLDRYIRGEINLATARLALKQKLAEIGYQPSEEEAGTLTDLSSDERINLILKMQSGFAYGYGNWMQGQHPAILDRWPAQELYRAYNRKTHRQWSGTDTDNIIKGEPPEGRWADAGGQFFDSESGDAKRMIALKNAPIWTAISRFGLPYPPFDFNSGMSIRDIKREEAMKLGLIDRDTRIQPETRDFNQDLKYTADIRNAALRQAVEDFGYTFVGDVLTP
jgi:hypothetical protein